MSSAGDVYHERKAAGICTKCGKNPARAGKTMCADCAKRVRSRAHSEYTERRAAGLCVKCGKPALPGRAKCMSCLKSACGYNKDHYLTGTACDGDCENCRFTDCVLEASPRDKHMTWMMKRADERKAEGLCVKCGKPAESGRNHCPACLAARRENYRKRAQARRDAGLCVNCGKSPPEPGKAKCKKCAEKDNSAHRKMHKKRVWKGVCTSCGRAPAAEGHVLCPECLAKMQGYNAARRTEGTARAGKKPASDHPWRRPWKRKIGGTDK